MKSFTASLPSNLVSDISTSSSSPTIEIESSSTLNDVSSSTSTTNISPSIITNVRLSAQFAHRVLAHRYLPFNVHSSAYIDSKPSVSSSTHIIPSLVSSHSYTKLSPNKHSNTSLNNILDSQSNVTDNHSQQPLISPTTSIPTFPSTSPSLLLSGNDHNSDNPPTYVVHNHSQIQEENSSIIYDHETNSYTHNTHTPDTGGGGSDTLNSLSGLSLASDSKLLQHQPINPSISQSHLHYNNTDISSVLSHKYLLAKSNLRDSIDTTGSRSIPSPGIPLSSQIPSSSSYKNLLSATSTNVSLSPIYNGPNAQSSHSPAFPHSTDHTDYNNLLEEHNYLTVGSQTDTITILGITSANDQNTVEIDNIHYSIPSLFGIVEDGVYRCGYPTPDQFPFLEQLRLKTVINLLDKLPIEYENFLNEHHIRYIHNAVKGNKAHCEEMDRKKVAYALSIIMDISNHPILIHCRSGKHRTGALVGCIRMLQRWTLENTCDEYVYYCKHKQRYVDKQYIERFDPRTLRLVAPPKTSYPAWLPSDCTEHASMLEEAIQRGEILPEDAEYGLPVSAMTKGPDEPGVIYQAVIRAHVKAAVAAEAAANAHEKLTLPEISNESIHGPSKLKPIKTSPKQYVLKQNSLTDNEDDYDDDHDNLKYKEEDSVLYESNKINNNEPNKMDISPNSPGLRTPTKKSYYSDTININNNEWLERSSTMTSPGNAAPGSGNSIVNYGYLSASPKDTNDKDTVLANNELLHNIHNRSPRPNTLTYDTSPTTNNNNNRPTINTNVRSTILPGKDGESIFTPPRNIANQPPLSRSSSLNANKLLQTGLAGRVSPITVATNVNSETKE